MSTSVIEPGSHLANRYRLEERISESGGSTLWKATDEILARAVAVRTFDASFPRIAEVVTAARAASRLTDPRLTQVFDADDSGANAYVVSEWVSGDSLEDMLSGKGPLEPGRAATLLHEAAEAIAAAHAAGLSHLCLTPADLLWTTGGTVKLLGIAVDAVLGDCRAEDPALEDARGLGRMLYAAVTAHWPGGTGSALPPAPAAHALAPPSHVKPGVPPAIDAVVRRVLVADSVPDPIATPAELAKALTRVPRTPLPLFAGLAGGPPPSVVQRPDRQTGPLHAHRPPQPRPTAAPGPQYAGRPPSTVQSAMPAQYNGHGGAPRPPRQAGGRASLPLLAIAAAALTVIAGIGAWSVLRDKPDKGSGGGGASAAPTDKKTKPTMGRIQIQGVTAIDDPIGPGNTDSSIGNNLQYVHDGDPTTIWHSQTYKSADFGRLEKGMGVVLDLGRPAEVSKVVAQLPGLPATLHLRVGDSAELAGMRNVVKLQGVTGEVELTPSKPTRTQFVLVWFTNPVPAGFKAQISEVAVYGSQ